MCREKRGYPALSFTSMSGSPVQLTAELRDKVAGWPEFRMGVHRVVVVLRDGTRVPDAFVSGDQIRGVGVSGDGTGPVPFGPDDIADVLDQSGW
jgi:hypothetical protein